jgi:hypothetical protein
MKKKKKKLNVLAKCGHLQADNKRFHGFETSKLHMFVVILKNTKQTNILGISLKKFVKFCLCVCVVCACVRTCGRGRVCVRARGWVDVCVRWRARARARVCVCVFLNNIQHALLQSNITCFRVKQLQYGYI